MRRLGELAQILNAPLFGEADLIIEDAKTTARASIRDITFACSEPHWELFLRVDAKAAIVSKSVSIPAPVPGKSYIQVEDAEIAFETIVRLFRPADRTSEKEISDLAIVSESAKIGDAVTIYPGAYIGEDVQIGSGCVIFSNATVLAGTTLGANTVIFPNVVLYEHTIVGERCLIHGGAVIGAYGFGYKSSTKHELSAQLGNVVIGNDVEIGSNTTIDRGTWDSTFIGDGTKLDNLVMIGHNCKIGKHNLFCSQVGIAGSTQTGDYVVMAGQVGIGDHLEIGDKVTIAAQSGVMNNLASDKVYLGSPAIPARDQMQIHATVAKLPEMRKQLRSLQKVVDQLIASSVDFANDAA